MSRRAIVDADLRFGATTLPGNWSPPESGFSWSLNGSSEAVLHGTPDDAPRLLLLEGHPFTHPPALTEQRLRVSLNGHKLAELAPPDLFAVPIDVPAGLLRQGRAILRFDHPDHASPSSFGQNDSRSLAFRMHRATLFRFQHTPAAPHPLTPLPGASAQLSAIARDADVIPSARALGEHILTQEHPALSPDDHDLHDLFSACVRRGLMLAATALLRHVTAHEAVFAEFDATAGEDVAAIRITKAPGAICRVGLSPKLRQQNLRAYAREHLVAYRALQIAPLLVRYARGPRACGSCLLNLGDESHMRGLAFCDVPSMASYLIPDSYFVPTSGYAAQRAVPPLPWNERHDVALWRGGTSGGCTGDLTTLPRWHLCDMARKSPLLDCGFTDAPLLSGWDGARIRAAGLDAPYVPPARFQEWKYQIDIDGNSNSWPGLFQKLLTGSTVLKVASPGRFRQWYYERLRPWREFVPVRPDLSDLLEKIELLRADDALARRIGEAGRALALSMTYDRELAAAEVHIEAAICAELRDAS